MQVICDANMFFMDVVCKYPGSCHDSFILRQSNIHSNFESGYYGDGILLGDSGYPAFWSIEAKMARNRPHWGKIMLHSIKNMQDIYVLLHSS